MIGDVQGERTTYENKPQSEDEILTTHTDKLSHQG